MKLIVSGGAGFIGSAFIRNHLKSNPYDKIVNIDNLTIGSNIDNLQEVKNNPNYYFIKDDIKNAELINEIHDADLIVNFAAETHVDRSISNPKPFIQTNYVGTYNLLEVARKKDKFFIHVSTDEIYGDATDDISFKEDDLLRTSNPYSATKAAADLLVNAYHRTYGLKCIITRCSNNFGPFQFPEKLIPKAIIRALKDLSIPLYGGGNQIRSWIYVLDHVEAIESLIKKGKPGEIYNITAWNEITNLSMIEKILNILGKPSSLIETVGDRPAHDKRYSIDGTKIKQVTGWEPKHSFDQSLKETVQWYQDNKEWWEPIADERILHPQPWTLKWE